MPRKTSAALTLRAAAVSSFNEAAAHAAENRPTRRRAGRSGTCFNEAAAHAAENLEPRLVRVAGHAAASMRPRPMPRKTSLRPPRQSITVVLQ